MWVEMWDGNYFTEKAQHIWGTVADSASASATLG
jgi:hypothetical protein